MGATEKEELARLRAEKIIRVQSGQMSAKEAARQLGVSRKTYYKWEKRLLSRMVEALSERSAGRPGRDVDEEKEDLRRRVAEMENEILVLRQTLRIREVLEGGAERRNRVKQREKEGISGPGAQGDRAACARIEGVFPGQEAQKTGKGGNDGSAAQASGAPWAEYGLEKKEARQGE